MNKRLGSIALGFYFLFLWTQIASSQTLFRGYPDLKKDGAIVFYLQTDSTRIALLQKHGDTLNAQKINQRATQFNKKLVAAFRKSFSFCPVYFIYADHIDAFIEHKSSPFFLDDSLQFNPHIQVQEKNIIYASVLHDYIYGKNGSPVTVTTVDMICLQDSARKPLAWPFPYYTELYTDFLLFPKKIEFYPRLLQNKLEIWYYYPSKRTVRILKKMGKWENAE